MRLWQRFTTAKRTHQSTAGQASSGTRREGNIVKLQAFRLSFALLLVSATSVVRAADAPPSTATDAEKSYLAVRNSKDPKTQLLAERWYKLIELREWSDASGKFKASAKYVEQDEKRGTVKLRVVKGTGKDQVVTDKTVVVDKLSKECQSRVKQIAFLTDKVDEAGKAEAEKATKPKEGADAMMGPPAPQAERSAHSPRESHSRPSPKDRKVEANGDVTPKADPAGETQAPQTAAAADAASPASAAIPPLPGVTGPGADAREIVPPTAAASPSATVSRPHGNPDAVQPANLPDQAPWRTSFDAFRRNLTPTRTENGWQLNWGELEGLKQAYDQATAVATDARGRDLTSATGSLDSLGEFTWEGALTQQPDEQTDWSKALGLTLPEPFRLICQLDSERGPGNWRRFFPGDQVKFIGRFVGFEGDGGIRIAIRFPDDVLAEPPARAEARQ
jgi:hypothetical protein